MDVSYSESSDYYSLDSYRDFEDFCEAVIRQTVEESRTRGPRHWVSEWVSDTDWLASSLHKISYNKYFLTDLINSFFFLKITCMATFNSRYFVLSVRPINYLEVAYRR